MSALLTQLWTAFESSIVSFAEGIKDAFLNLIYVDPTAATPVVSDFAIFGFILGGLGLAMAIVKGISYMVRRQN